MDEIQKSYLLIFLGILAIILELLLGVATGFDLLIIGIIAMLSGGIGVITTSFTNALIGVTVLSLLYMFIGRRFIRKELSIKTQATNVDALMGKKGIVVKQIIPAQAGQVKVDGEIWRAEADKTIDKGKTITIESVSGVTLHVV